MASPVTFDDIIEKVGGFGKFQKTQLVFLLIPVSIYTGYQSNSILFQTHVPDHWCQVPGRENTSYSVEEWKDLTIPKKEDGSLEKCLQYDVSWDSSNRPIISNKTNECLLGVDHDTSQFAHTTVTSLGWLCGDKSSAAAHILAVNTAGNAVGLSLFPLLADKLFGRRAVFFFLMGLLFTSNMLLTFVTSFPLHLFFRFLSGLTFYSYYHLPYVIVLELMSPLKRSMCTFISFVTWTWGMCLASLVAWLLPHWIHLNIATTFPAILFYLLWRVVPESPRVLLSQGKFEETAAVIQKIAETNGKPEPADLLTMLKKVGGETTKAGNILKIFKYPTLRNRAFLLMVQSPCVYLVYGCLLINIDILPSNIFLNHFVLSLFEMPADLLGWALSHYLGRRVGVALAFLATGIVCGIASAYTHSPWMVLAMCALAKFFTVLVFYIVYLYINELYPTPIRTTGFGMTGVIGTLSIVAAPYVSQASRSYLPLQYWVMVGLSLMGAVVSLSFPETLGLPLPQTMNEANQLGKGQPFFSWIHHWNYKKYNCREQKEMKTSE